MKPDNLYEVTSLILDEIRLLKKKGFTLQELEKSKEQLKGNYILGLESTSSRMNAIGKSELLLGYINTQEEILQKIDNINMDSVTEVIDRIFDLDRKAVSIVGHISKSFNPLKFIADFDNL